MVSRKLDFIFNEAVSRANKLSHEYLTLEILLAALLKDSEVRSVLQNCGIDLAMLDRELDETLKDKENFSVLTEDLIEELSKEHFRDEDVRKIARSNGIRYQPEMSEALHRVLQRAAIHVQSSGKKEITGVNLLVALFNEKESLALYLIEKQGVEKIDIVREIAHGVDRPANSGQELDAQYNGEENEEGAEDGAPVTEERKALKDFCLNLNERARKKEIDPLIGRETEIERIIQILVRRRKNNPLLVGEAGVGKTAIAEGLAYLIVNNDAPESLQNSVVFSLDMASLLAGAKFRGDFEKRLKDVIRDLEKVKDKEGIDPILFIDEMHTIMGAGATGGGSLDASNLLKPMLSSGKLKCIGSTTYDEYRKFIEKDHAFSRRFQKIDVDEPTSEETYQILLGLRSKFEEFHGVKYPNNVVKLMVELADRYLSDRKNPDKSIDVMDEVGAMIKLKGKNHQATKKDVEQVIATVARVPKLNVHQDERSKLKNLKIELKAALFGQDHAIDQVVDTILLSRSGLANLEKPIGAFLFAGPTGVGKTELAKKIAEQLGSHLQRIDMSEYMEKHAVAKLVGAPPGYVGYDQGGLLTDAIKKHPHSVLLLDEIEKAHPDVFNILLQIMDYGKLTDSQGRTTDYRNVILIMTSNAGAKEMQTGAVGLTSSIEKSQNSDVNSSKRDKAIKDYFSPEFRNRLSAIVHFNRLEREQILKIVEKFLTELDSQLMKKKVVMSVSDSLKEHLAKVGYDPLMGARPLQRIVDEKIKKPLSHEILFGKLEKGGEVFVDFDEMNGIVFKF